MNSVPAFALNGVVKRYPGFTLGPLDLTLEAGTVVGFVGPNGSGKTTTLNCIAGLVVPEAGTVEVFGRRTNDRTPAWKEDLGVVGETHGFYRGWTVEENLRFLSRFYPGWSDQRARRLADRLGLPLGKKVSDLSKGHLAKLAMVAALGHGPRLLLLDEPTAGLDPVVRAEVLDVLWEVLEDAEHAIFYSTHVLSDISRLADDLVFLYEGRVLLRSPKDALTERWRRISFRLTDADVAVASAVEYRRVRAEHQVVSDDGEATLTHLRELGAQAIEQSCMTIDEIAVAILKGGSHVAPR
ncbi:MAG TPA: ABC transporter ATP-binding protein [Thermoanaerobaculaceae bacterium]|jgi:ABC-2 type transport system ATP-binding protein|nr:ABC transporter ATP-binding protein [Thermoanaerobaculaceae bacterium]